MALRTERTAWTASVWGKAQAPLAHNEHVELKDGEEECAVCYNGAIKVLFKPCNHGSCMACMERLRAANIFKADAGVKCPFCRQFVDGYRPFGGDKSVIETLTEANRAAAAAAAARDGDKQEFPSSSSQNLQTQRTTWTCTVCQATHPTSTTSCNRCTADNKLQLTPAAKDILRCTVDDIYLYCNQKLHSNLNRAFLDAGVPFIDGKVTGSKETILAAAHKKGQAKLIKVIQLLAAHHRIRELSVEWFGNYTLQDLLESAAKLRDAAGQAAATQPELVEVIAGPRKSDVFALLHKELIHEAAKLACHAQASYVMQTLVKYSSPEEIIELSAQLLPQAADLTVEQKGSHVIVKLVDQLSLVAFTEGPVAQRAAQQLEELCGMFSKSKEKLLRIAGHFIGSQALSEAIQTAIPRRNALKCASMLATNAGTLTSGKGGNATLKQLLGLKAVNSNCQEVIRELLCYCAASLQGHFAAVTHRISVDGPQVVRKLLERLDEERVLQWVSGIVSDLVAKAGVMLTQHQQSIEVLEYALTLETLEDDDVKAHVEDLYERYSDIEWHYLVDRVWQVRNARHNKPGAQSGGPQHGAPQYPSVPYGGQPPPPPPRARPPQHSSPQQAPPHPAQQHTPRQIQPHNQPPLVNHVGQQQAPPPTENTHLAIGNQSPRLQSQIQPSQAPQQSQLLPSDPQVTMTPGRANGISKHAVPAPYPPPSQQPPVPPPAMSLPLPNGHYTNGLPPPHYPPHMHPHFPMQPMSMGGSYNFMPGEPMAYPGPPAIAMGPGPYYNGPMAMGPGPGQYPMGQPGGPMGPHHQPSFLPQFGNLSINDVQQMRPPVPPGSTGAVMRPAYRPPLQVQSPPMGQPNQQQPMNGYQHGPMNGGQPQGPAPTPAPPAQPTVVPQQQQQHRAPKPTQQHPPVVVPMNATAASRPSMAQVSAGVAYVDGPWSCQVCTYEHVGDESKYLQCAVCATDRGHAVYTGTR